MININETIYNLKLVLETRLETWILFSTQNWNFIPIY